MLIFTPLDAAAAFDIFRQLDAAIAAAIYDAPMMPTLLALRRHALIPAFAAAMPMPPMALHEFIDADDFSMSPPRR